MSEWTKARLGDVTTQIQHLVKVAAGESYPLLGVRWYAEGPFLRETVTSKTSKASRFYRVRPGQFIYNRLFAGKGSFGLVGAELDGSYVSNEFPLFDCDATRLLPEFLNLHFRQTHLWEEIERVSTGTTASRNRWKEAQFNDHRIALPTVDEQRRIVEVMAAIDAQIDALSKEVERLHAVTRLRRADLVNDEAVAEVRAEQAFEFSTGVRRTPDRASGPSMTPYLRSANVGYGSLDLSDVQEMNYEPHEREKFGLRYGDVLVSEGSASARAVGMPAMWRDELPSPVCFQMTLLRLRAIEAVCSPSFAFQWCMWAYESGRFLDVAGGTSIKHISARRSTQMPVRLPSLARQGEVAEELDSMSTQLVSGRDELSRLRMFRSTLLASLMNQDVEIPESYDALLEAAS